MLDFAELSRWVVSQNASGRLNAAPFSFFNAFSGDRLVSQTRPSRCCAARP